MSRPQSLHSGNKLTQKEIGDEGLIPFCERCSVPLWDMFTTSVICAVVNEQREVALIRQGYVSDTNHVCVAGIMKPGESAEETAVREIREEIGQDVVKLEYIKSYPYEKKSMLMLGYKAIVKKADFRLSGEVDSAGEIRGCAGAVAGGQHRLAAGGGGNRRGFKITLFKVQ